MELKILHISDLHISSPVIGRQEKICREPILISLAEIIEAYKDEIDAILITGDLVDKADAKNLRLADVFLNGPGTGAQPKTKIIKPTLSKTGLPVVVLPGNHDRFVDYLAKPYGSKLFDSVLAKNWQPDQHGIQVKYLLSDDKPLLAIISADFSLENLNDVNETICAKVKSRYAQGIASSNRLASLKKTTTEAQKKCPVIWAMHFAPVFEEFYDDFDRCLELNRANSLVKLADDLNVKYIFCGHTHFCGNYKTSMSDNLVICCSGTSTCYYLKKSWDTVIHTCTFEIDGHDVQLLRRNGYRWDENMGSFEDDKECNNLVDKNDRKCLNCIRIAN